MDECARTKAHTQIYTKDTTAKSHPHGSEFAINARRTSCVRPLQPNHPLSHPGLASHYTLHTFLRPHPHTHRSPHPPIHTSAQTLSATRCSAVHVLLL